MLPLKFSNEIPRVFQDVLKEFFGDPYRSLILMVSFIIVFDLFQEIRAAIEAA